MYVYRHVYRHILSTYIVKVVWNFPGHKRIMIRKSLRSLMYISNVYEHMCGCITFS